MIVHNQCQEERTLAHLQNVEEAISFKSGENFGEDGRVEMQCVGANWHFSTAKLQREDRNGISNSQSRIAVSRPRTLKNGKFPEAGEASSSFFPPPHVESITSTSNPFVKHCVKLRQSSSYRHSHGFALVVGSTPIREICHFDALNSERSKILECLLLLEEVDVNEKLYDVLPSRKISVSPAVMRKLSGVQSTESIDAIALIRTPSSFVHLSNNDQVETDCKRWFPSCHRILVLEGIQDPGNLGTLLRSAMAFRWSGVFLLDGCCDPLNEKALRASRGASFQLPIVCGSWVHLNALGNDLQMKMLAGHPHSADPHKPSVALSHSLAGSLSDTPLCLVLGSEGAGLSSWSKGSCELVSIPMAGQFESLNVAVAGGIFLYMLQSDRQC